MTRVEFKLAMPRRGSWDSRWSGEDRNYTIVKELDDDRALALDGRSWTYAWPDGWMAQVTARLIRDEAALKVSHGFHGYGWMVDSILRHDRIFADHERPEIAP